MRICIVACMLMGLLSLVTGCQTKVYNQPPAARSTVIEHDHPIVTEDHTPDVQNNIHVDRDR